MESEEILEYLKEEILENYVFNGYNIKKINRDTTVEELDLDNLDLLEITLDLESEYDVLIDDNELKNVVTIGDLIDLILDEDN